MRIICVDDEKLVLGFAVHLCKELPQVDEVKGFSSALEALDWLKENPADIALLDIDMPNMNGISLAVKIKEQCPHTAIIFLTGYSHYAVEAFKIHAQGYLLKPISKEKLAEEIDYALSAKAPVRYPHLYARTFGEFNLLIDGKPVHFARSKSEELLAYLIDKRGAGVSRSVVFAALYEDALYDRKMQKQLDVIIRSLRETLVQNGADGLFQMKAGKLWVNTEMFECDLYRLLDGDADAVNSFRGEYMSSYSWASMTETNIAINIHP